MVEKTKKEIAKKSFWSNFGFGDAAPKPSVKPVVLPVKKDDKPKIDTKIIPPNPLSVVKPLEEKKIEAPKLITANTKVGVIKKEEKKEVKKSFWSNFVFGDAAPKPSVKPVVLPVKKDDKPKIDTKIIASAKEPLKIENNADKKDAPKEEKKDVKINDIKNGSEPKKFTDRELIDILVTEDYVSKEESIRIGKDIIDRRLSLVDYLLSEGILSRDLLGQAIAEAFKVSYSDLNSNPPLKELCLKLPEATAKELRAVPFKEDESFIVVATDNPTRSGIVETFGKLFPLKKVKLTYSLPEDIDATFSYYHKPLNVRIDNIVASSDNVAPEVINEILNDALLLRASDVHFEPQADIVLIRLRIDGVLHEVGRLARLYFDNVVNRIKVQSHLRIDDHFSSQDGSMRYVRGTRTVDLRVSIVPTLDGEKIVIRVLAEYVKGFTLADLGLNQEGYDIFVKSANKPFGMIVVTGPTGSGKTTSLYSLLKVLHTPDVNIMTIEDPAEYRMVGVNQIQVNLQTNLTFAKGLRSIVRQDPDIILVGEIRDAETADIAVNAALTGHLLLSTFHANDAATAIPRMLDMGIEPFLLSSTLELIVAQRLVRKICEQCRYSYKTNVEELKKVFDDAGDYFSGDDINLYKGKGCDACNNTGFRGRTAIFEFIRNTPELQALIMNNPSSSQIWEVAYKSGSKGLFYDGMGKVKNGITTLEELLRVALPPEK